MRRDGRRSEKKQEAEVEPKIMRHRTHPSKEQKENASDCCAVPTQLKVSTDLKHRSITSSSKRKRSSLSICVSRCMRMLWLGFGLYGFSMLVIRSMSLMAASSHGHTSVDYTHHLRKTLMADNIEHAIAPHIKHVPEHANRKTEEAAKDADRTPPETAKKGEGLVSDEKKPADQVEPSERVEKPDTPVAEPVENKPNSQAMPNEPVNKPVEEKAVEEKAVEEKPIEQEHPKQPEVKNSKKEKAYKKNISDGTKKDETKPIAPFKGVPNVLLVGAQKSGTTAVASWIFHHANVCKPKSADNGEPIKEVHFFDLEDEMYSKGLGHYKNHFKHCRENSPHVLDATPDYLPHADRVANIYKQAGAQDDVKIVMILREPVDREFSFFHHMAEEHYTSENPRPYTERVLDENGKLLSFDNYVTSEVLPELSSSFGMYSKWISEWMAFFDRKQILILSYEELSKDPNSLMDRLQRFLDLPVGEDVAPQSIVKLNERAKHRTNYTPSCISHAKLAEAFDPYNQELYKMLENHPGPDAEQRPFPEFRFKHCRTQSLERLEARKKASESHENTNAEQKQKTKAGKSKKGPPETVYFATHHKTGTDISRSVASLLQKQGLVTYSEEFLNENNLFRDGKGKAMTCSGTDDKPEIRSYNQWPKWMIDAAWSDCLGKWWDSWPNGGGSKDGLQQCMTSQIKTLKKQLKYSSCEKTYLVVHFVRNPIDLILSSYRYTKLGKEGWMHEKVGKHPKFKQELCGKHNCKDMTIQEAIRDLPTEVGLQLEMHLVSLEIIKQMMVASAMAEIYPDRHLTVSLSDIMESSESFNETWRNILQHVLPTKSNETIGQLVQALQKFDMNADPDNFAGKAHSTVGTTGKEEGEQQKGLVLLDGNVKSMLGDPLLKTLL